MIPAKSESAHASVPARKCNIVSSRIIVAGENDGIGEELTVNRRIVGIAALLLLVAVASMAAFWPYGPNVLRLPGIVEVQEVRLGSKVGGRVAKILVNEGDMVYPRQPLVIFEAPELENQKRQQRARLDSAVAEWLRAVNGPRIEDKRGAQAAANAAEARYQRTKNGWREEEKSQAISEWEAARADYEQAVKDWNRVTELYARQAAARSEYDAALAYRDRSLGRLNAALARKTMLIHGSRQEDIAEMKAEWQRTQAKYEELANGTRWEEIALALAKVTEIEAKIEEIDINLKESTVVVPDDFGEAVVEVLSIRPGDLVPANQPVVRVLRTKDLWVKIFVPETKYGLVTLRKKVEVTIDSHPGRTFQGEIVQRANISEFTPRNVQSVDERRHQVFGVKILVPEHDGVFNAGMAAQVTIPLD